MKELLNMVIESDVPVIRYHLDNYISSLYDKTIEAVYEDIETMSKDYRFKILYTSVRSHELHQQLYRRKKILDDRISNSLDVKYIIDINNLIDVLIKHIQMIIKELSKVSGTVYNYFVYNYRFQRKRYFRSVTEIVEYYDISKPNIYRGKRNGPMSLSPVEVLFDSNHSVSNINPIELYNTKYKIGIIIKYEDGVVTTYRNCREASIDAECSERNVNRIVNSDDNVKLFYTYDQWVKLDIGIGKSLIKAYKEV